MNDLDYLFESRCRMLYFVPQYYKDNDSNV